MYLVLTDVADVHCSSSWHHNFTICNTTINNTVWVKKTMHLTFDHNVGKYRPIFKILSLTNSHVSARHLLCVPSIRTKVVVQPVCSHTHIPAVAGSPLLWWRVRRTARLEWSLKWTSHWRVQTSPTTFERHRCHSTVCDCDRCQLQSTAVRDVTDPAKIRICRMRILCAKSVRQVLKTSIFVTNTSMRMFILFTGTSFINDCCSPCYTSIIHCFSSLTSHILLWTLLHCFSDFTVTGFRPELFRWPRILKMNSEVISMILCYCN